MILVTMGRPPKPIEQLKRTGNYRTDRQGNRGPLVAIAPVDSSPHDLDPAAVFRHVMEAGAPWFASTDAIRLAMLRESLEERARLMQHAEAAPEFRKSLRELNREISEWLSLLGFDPTSRSRLGLAEVKAMSKLEKMQAERNR